jgi:hypothetical protein
MLASTHVFRFRSLADAARSLARDRHRLARVPGLRFSRLVFVGGLRSEGFNIGIVDPRRQMAMCVWDSEPALERFLGESAIGRRWRERTDEFCEVRLAPLRTHGRYRGMEPFAGLQAGLPGPGPVALWTFAEISPRGLWFFWDEIRGAARRLFDAPGLVAGTAGPEHLYTGAMTFTIWESLPAALDYSYRDVPHRGIVRRVRAESLLRSSMFVRFQVLSASGRWPARSRFAERYAALAYGSASPSNRANTAP